MRYIDADELKKDDEVKLWLSNDAVRAGKTLKMFSELFVKKIDEQPTIQAVPIDVFDKLRAEVNEKIRPWLDFEDRERDRNDAFLEVLDIIDKYRAEWSDK